MAKFYEQAKAHIQALEKRKKSAQESHKSYVSIDGYYTIDRPIVNELI